MGVSPQATSLGVRVSVFKGVSRDCGEARWTEPGGLTKRMLKYHKDAAHLLKVLMSLTIR